MTFKVGGVSLAFQGLRRAGIEGLIDKEFNSIQGIIGFFFQVIPSVNSIHLNTHQFDIQNVHMTTAFRYNQVWHL